MDDKIDRFGNRGQRRPSPASSSAVFIAPNPDRRCTPYSIAAHSLYEESHPQLQFYPEGILAMERIEFFGRDGRTAGINRLAFDVVCTSPENHEAALRANAFCARAAAGPLGLPQERIVSTFHVDSCNALKISVDRPNISTSPDEHDVFGAQQQSAIERMTLPLHAGAIAMASAF